MKNAGIDMICRDKRDWSKSLLEFYSFDNQKRMNISKKVKEFANKNYNKKKLISQWYNVFKTVL